MISYMTLIVGRQSKIQIDVNQHEMEDAEAKTLVIVL